MGWGPTLVKTGYTSDYWHFYASSPHYYNLVEPGTGGPYRGMSLPAAPPMAHGFYSAGFYATSFVRVDASVFSAQWLGLLDSGSAGSSFGATGRAARCAHDATGNMSATTELPKLQTMVSRGYQAAFSGCALAAAALLRPGGERPLDPNRLPALGLFLRGHRQRARLWPGLRGRGLDYLVFANFAVLKGA
jgi:hypothetical protein